jgi:hypothetical protein
MKLGIMQPYFLPYLGYISLIKHTDEFILFDTVQFIRHGWIERNRILKQDEGWQYINIPLQKHSHGTKIQNIKVNNLVNWQDRIIAQLGHYKKKSPFYNQTLEVINKGFAEKTESIVKLNYNTLNAVCEYLNISFNCSIFSERNIAIETVNSPDEWALNICKALGYNEYWNPPGGQEFFDKLKYEKAGIKLIFHKIISSVYSQYKDTQNFEPNLSIIDVMMFNSVEKINQMLDDFELV